MKKFFICALVLLIFVASVFFFARLLVEIRPQLPAAQETSFDGVIYETTRVACGEVYFINENLNEVTFLLDDGSMWKACVENIDKFDLNGYYVIFFDTMGTNAINDDEIVKAFVECW